MAKVKLTVEQQEDIVNRFQNGEKYASILKDYPDVSRKALRGAIIRAGAFKPRRKTPYELTENDILEMVGLYRSGVYSVTDLARKFGISDEVIARKLSESGLTVIRKNLLSSTIKMPTEIGLLNYIAGIFDGEGNIHHRRDDPTRLNRFQLYIINTNRELMDFLLANIGGIVIERKFSADSNHFGKKQIYDWRIQRFMEVKQFLEAVLPYLIIKKAEAVKALEDMKRVTEPVPLL